MGKSLQSKKNALIAFIDEIIHPLGYFVVDLELHKSRSNKIQIFIDLLEESEKKLGIGDCVLVSRKLDEPLEKSEFVTSVFGDSYELEVSSPGIERPLRTIEDYKRFTGKEARLNLFRTLSKEEIENDSFLEKNKKRKTFLGFLAGTENKNEKILLDIILLDIKKNKTELETIKIPLHLISKASLAPPINFEKGKT